MLMLSFILLCIVVFLISYLIYNRFCYFANRSIPSPPIPSIIFGHLSDLWSARSYSEQLHKWTHKYGSIYGIFEGIHPVYVISDVKIIQEIFVTQFHRFYGRRTQLSNRILGQERLHVFATNSNDQWKRQRTILNPAFSISKMKRIIPIMDSSIDVFIEKLSLKNNEKIINILDFYKRLTMDIICRCAFGIDTKIQYDIDNKNIYMKKVQEVLEKDFERSFLARIHRIMPFSFLANICSILFRLQHIFKYEKSSFPANFWLINHMDQFIQQRFVQTNYQESTNDLLQLMIDAVQSDTNKLSSYELLSNAYLMLAAGFETTSTALGYCTYRLAIHQNIQEKLYQEIVKYNSSDINSYEILVNKLIYLDMFVHEVLRMHPIAIQPVHRQCMEDTYIDKYYIKKGTLIQVDVLSIHYDSEYWGPEPVHEFCPERHTRKRNSLAFMPFGGGPRTCLGMRFAFLEIKLCLVRLINEYRILPTDDIEQKLNITEQFVVAPEHVYVKLEKRSI
ncbi:unnamed protein product [Rotaria sp. Silwood1]|nr:unnamed protein product [Rotaria sp. Silwood1]CAF4800896.1 unnamed protein product [Rotaria sp. Silwood1]